MKQVITVSKNGSISSLQRKDGFDLRRMGHVHITRTSDIVWDTLSQRWFISIINGPAIGTVLTWDNWKKVGFRELPPNSRIEIGLGVLSFEEYEDAVKTEIVYLDALRKRGTF